MRLRRSGPIRPAAESGLTGATPAEVAEIERRIEDVRAEKRRAVAAGDPRAAEGRLRPGPHPKGGAP